MINFGRSRPGHACTTRFGAKMTHFGDPKLVISGPDLAVQTSPVIWFTKMVILII